MSGEYRLADSRFHLAIAAVTESPLTIRSVAGVQADVRTVKTAMPIDLPA